MPIKTNVYIKDYDKWIEYPKEKIPYPKSNPKESFYFDISISEESEITNGRIAFWLDFDYEQNNYDTGGFINFVFDNNIEQLQEFINNLKTDNFAFFTTHGVDDNLPNDTDCQLMAFPVDDRYRFMILYQGCDEIIPDVFVDILITKEIIVKEFEKAYQYMLNIYTVFCEKKQSIIRELKDKQSWEFNNRKLLPNEVYQKKFREDKYNYINNPNWDEECDVPYKTLVEQSNSIKTDALYIESVVNAPIASFYEADYHFVIVSDFGKSYLWISEAIGNINELWYFIESICNIQDFVYYNADQEGTETYFVAQKIDEENIRFIHITDDLNGFNPITKKSFKAYSSIYPNKEYWDKPEPYTIRQDIIVNRERFISCFYKELVYIFSQKIYSEEKTVQHKIKTSSIIIFDYLEKCKYKKYEGI